MTASRKRLLIAIAIVVVVAIGGYYAWTKWQAQRLSKGIAWGNGRIEATEIDIAAKDPGRIKEVLVDEGDFVTAGQIIALMDTELLNARKREAEAQLQQAIIGVDTAKSQATQRHAERDADAAIIAQRNAELDAAQKRLNRSAELARKGNVSAQVLDDDRARAEGARAAVGAAQAQLAAAEAAISAAQSAIIGAEAAVQAAKATIQRIDADLNDSVLKSPRDGRVQFRVAQPGEVLSAGGRVLNLVDLSDVYMTFFLPTEQVGQLTLGDDVRLVLDAAPQYIIPAKISYVADVAQFTPKTVETAEERQKLMFRVKARIAPELLRKYIRQVKTGLPGMAYVRLAPDAPWPANLQGKLVQ